MNKVIKLERLIRRRKKILLLNYLIPAAITLFTGINSMREGMTDTLAFINVILGGLMAIFGLKECRSLKKKTNTTIRWYEFISGLVLLGNAASLYNPKKGFQPAYLYLATSILVVLKSIFVIEPLNLFHRATISDVGFRLRMGPFSVYSFTWEEVSEIEIRDKMLHITTTTGSRNISPKKIADTEKLNTALLSSLKKRAGTLESLSAKP